ncbi:hypothetical protein [Brochothrix campestris]|uniref:Permease n=2 Tax=Brochothrix campestris TaxID=2757 RepID=W7D5F3_9LIST|nr:hypothetical protein [Brochothrix campestris]EUJ40498.1 permease [Brochothrix campestris FSL F6-1037]
MNQAGLQFADMHLMEGTFFTSPTFLQTYDMNVPVLLGAAYRPYHSISDTLKIEYLGAVMNVVVQGFTAQNQVLFLREDETFDLNRYLILPFLIDLALPQSEQTAAFQQRHFLNAVNGYLYTNDSLSHVQHAIAQASATINNFPSLQIIGVSTQFISDFIAGLQESQLYLRLITMVLFICTTAAVTALAVYKIKLFRADYVLHLVIGAKWYFLTTVVMVELLLQTVLASFIVVLPLYWFSGSWLVVGRLAMLLLVMQLLPGVSIAQVFYHLSKDEGGQK